ncbi:sterol carrier family protein [Micrococcoides hystricis]|uniref:Sterol carrier family protein n=1 Tax=Micrococcoides hystricis TaxID=1572761 RepID=A0ABV6PD26_9MICC
MSPAPKASATPRRRVPIADGIAAVQTLRAQLNTAATDPADMFTGLPRQVTATAVRYLLEELAARAPGNAVEIRVPPFGVTQAVAGPRHTRGTPPNVVEMTPAVFLAVALGLVPAEDIWDSITASGIRADLRQLFPLVNPAHPDPVRRED